MSTNNSQTVGGISVIQQAFDDLLAYGIESDINLNGYTITNSANPINAQDLATKSYVLSQVGGSLPSGASLSDISTANPSVTDITASTQKITNLQLGILSTDSANVQNITNAISTASSNYMPATNSLATIASANPSLTSISASSQQIKNIAAPTAGFDAVTLNYADTTYWPKIPLNQISTNSLNTGSVQMNSQKIIGLLDPTLAQDASTKKYVDDSISNLDLANTYTLQTDGLNEINQRTPENVILSTNYITSTAVIISNDQYINSGQVDAKITTAGGSYRPLVDSLAIISTTSPALTDIDANIQKIVNVQDPTDPQDVVTQQYLEDVLNNRLPQSYIEDNTANSKVQTNSDYVFVQPDIIGGSLGMEIRKNPEDSLGIGLYYTGKLYINSNSIQAVSGVDFSDQYVANIADADSAQDAVNRRTMDRKSDIRNGSSTDAQIEIIDTNEIQITLDSEIVVQLSNNGSDGLQIDSNELNILVSNPLTIALPITVNSKIGYDPASLITITESTQFADKAYVDASGGGNTTQTLSEISIANPNNGTTDQNGYEIINCPGIGLNTPTDITFDVSPQINFNITSRFEEAVLMGVSKFIYINILTDYSTRASDQAVPTIQFCDDTYQPIGGISGSLQDVYDGTPSDLNVSTNIISSSHTATTTNELINFGQAESTYLPISQSFWIKSPTTGTVTQYVAVDTAGQINFTVSSVNNLRLVKQSIDDAVLYNPVGDLTIQSESGPYISIQNSTGSNHVSGILTYDSTYSSFSGTQIPSYAYILANFRLASATLNTINNTNPVTAQLDFGIYGAKSSYVASVGNDLINQSYYLSHQFQIYDAASITSRLYFPTASSMSFAETNYGDLITTSVSTTTLTENYKNQDGGNPNQITDVVNTASTLLTRLWSTGSTAVYKQYQTASSSIYNMFTGIAGYASDYSASFSATSNQIPSCKWVNNNYALQSSIQPVQVGSLLMFPGGNYSAASHTGYLPCNATAFSSSTYPLLYAFLGNIAVTPDMRAFGGLYMKSTELDATNANNYGGTSITTPASHFHTSGTLVPSVATNSATTSASNSGGVNITYNDSSQNNGVAATFTAVNNITTGTSGSTDLTLTHTHTFPPGNIVMGAQTMSGNTGSTGSTYNQSSYQLVLYFIKTD